MANWLQKILPPALPKGQVRRNLPVNRQGGPLTGPSRPPSPGQLPNASVIYGVAAAVLFVIGLYFVLFGHRPFPGLLVMLLGGCFLGFALHFLKYPQ